MNVNTQNWDKRNVWPLPSGELVVRQTLVNVADAFATSAKKYLGGFSVKNPRTEEVWHYCLTLEIGLTTDLYLRIFPEWFDWENSSSSIEAILLNSTTYSSGLEGLKFGFSYALVEDEIIITSPFFGTYWGIVGGGLILAAKQASGNPNTTAIEIPRGISCSWAGRSVIATSDALHFSDALKPRTYVAENIVNPPGGSIYGLHVNSGGALIICTTSGVYAFPEDAAASGQVIVGIFSKLTDYETVSYDSTVSHKGRVYGLTRKGYRLIDDSGSDEYELDEKAYAHFDEPRIHFDDYRNGRIFSMPDAIVVSVAEYLHLTDMNTRLGTWWYRFSGEPAKFDLRGTLLEGNGEAVFLFYDAPAWECGNKGATIKGSITGNIQLGPENSPVLRHLDFMSDSYATYTIHVNNTSKTKAGFANAPIVGTDTWTGGTKYREAAKRSRQTDWAIRGDDININIDVSHYPHKIPNTVDLVFKGPGKKRPDA